MVDRSTGDLSQNQLVSMNKSPGISVIICTRDRADSLKMTLECLVSANREGMQAEVVVVDNASSDHTKDVVTSFRDRIAIRYLHEPTHGVYGKSHGLNRALDEGGLGEIIALLDDDMSLEPDWFQAVKAICQRWSDKDIFTGDVYVVWPPGPVPAWAKTERAQRLILSSLSFGAADLPARDGWFYSGNHMWFRSRVFEGKRRFRDVWLTEPDFQLDLAELGFAGVSSPEARAGHRVQGVLLQKDVALERAKKFGIADGRLRLQPYRHKVKQARLLRKHPWLGVGFCASKYLWWSLLQMASYCLPSDGAGFELRLFAVNRRAFYRELLRRSNRSEEYSRGVQTSQPKPAPSETGIGIA